MEIIVLKNTITDIKKPNGGSAVERTEDRTSELQDRSIKLTHSEQQHFLEEN